MKKKINLIMLFSVCMLAMTPVFAYKCPNNLDYVGCGNGVNAVTGIPAMVPRLVSFAVTLMKVIIPVALVITGTIEMFKSIIAGNPDNIPKGKKKIINKFVAALLAFFIISFTTNIVKLIARRNERSTLAACLSCYLNNNCNDDISVCTGVNDKEIGNSDISDDKIDNEFDSDSYVEIENSDSNNSGSGTTVQTNNSSTVTSTPTPTTTPTTTTPQNTKSSSPITTENINNAVSMGMPSNVASFLKKIARN